MCPVQLWRILWAPLIPNATSIFLSNYAMLQISMSSRASLHFLSLPFWLISSRLRMALERVTRRKWLAKAGIGFDGSSRPFRLRSWRLLSVHPMRHEICLYSSASLWQPWLFNSMAFRLKVFCEKTLSLMKKRWLPIHCRVGSCSLQFFSWSYRILFCWFSMCKISSQVVHSLIFKCQFSCSLLDRCNCSGTPVSVLCNWVKFVIDKEECLFRRHARNPGRFSWVLLPKFHWLQALLGALPFVKLIAPKINFWCLQKTEFLKWKNY